jgi:hypothetical protein
MMKNLFSVALVSALIVLSAPLYAGNTPAIGVATSVGTISVNQAITSGSTDVADGSVLQTTSAPSDVHMASGADVRLATRSAGTFYADHVLLEEGAVRVGNFNGLTVDARQLQVSSDESAARAVIRITRKTIEVASVGGSVNVMDSGLLTRVAAGTKMSFQQSGATPAAQQPTSGAAPAAPKSKLPSEQKTFIVAIGVVAVGALVVGLTAAAQGKSPF